MNWIQKDQHYLAPVYKKYPLTLVKGKGNRVWDEQGKEYLDFYGGHAVCSLGHCHEAVTKAITAQAETLIFYSNAVYTTPAIELAEALANTLAPEPYQVYFTNSGSEANEAAIKMARKHTGKQKIISFKNAFHGRAITNLAVTGIDAYHRFTPNLDDYTSFAELGDMDSVIQAYDDETAAVICEPIQSIGGVLQAPPSFYQDLANFCKEKGILLIFDEVQTGVGRTGYFWAAQLFKVTPDIITSAKGLATGLPIAAVLINHSVSEKLDLSDHASTFGGGPIPCAAGFAVVSTISSDGFLAEVLKKSDYLQAQLRSLPHVREVRGEGFLLGFELDQAFPDFLNSVLANGLITGGASHKNTYRLTPPLTISTDDIDECIRILDSILSQ